MEKQLLPFRLRVGEMLWSKILQPYLFDRDAEKTHLFTIRSLKRIQELGLLWVLKLFYCSPSFHNRQVCVAGVYWRNPVGLAAGFDKHGEILPALDALGFGSVEIGTVTPRPQKGNDLPRIFRYPELKAIINRCGFNSDGANVVAERIKKVHLLPFSRWSGSMPIGISIGKNKETPDNRAVDDYLEAFRLVAPILRPWCDWVKINISSPNTPNLRNFFFCLHDFLDAFMEEARLICRTSAPPFILKIPPDNLNAQQLEDIVKTAARNGFAGIEATNTTISQEIKCRYGLQDVAGGLSGEPLRSLSTQILAQLRKPALSLGLDLIGVGGISRGEHAVEKREAGARAVQVYTGLVFRGPLLVHEILEAWS
jgi:dihydroorotate dehydrogenase